MRTLVGADEPEPGERRWPVVNTVSTSSTAWTAVIGDPPPGVRWTWVRPTATWGRIDVNSTAGPLIVN
jgi:hypothetical protein